MRFVTSFSSHHDIALWRVTWTFMGPKFTLEGICGSKIDLLKPKS